MLIDTPSCETPSLIPGTAFLLDVLMTAVVAVNVSCGTHIVITFVAKGKY